VLPLLVNALFAMASMAAGPAAIARPAPVCRRTRISTRGQHPHRQLCRSGATRDDVTTLHPVHLAPKLQTLHPKP